MSPNTWRNVPQGRRGYSSSFTDGPYPKPSITKTSRGPPDPKEARRILQVRAGAYPAHFTTKMESSLAPEVSLQPSSRKAPVLGTWVQLLVQTSESKGGFGTSDRHRVAPGKEELKEGGDITSRNSPQAKDLAPCKDKGGLGGRF